MGYTTQVKILSTTLIQHKGKAALWQTMEATPELKYLYCTESINRLIVLSEAWPSAKRAYVVSGGAV